MVIAPFLPLINHVNPTPVVFGVVFVVVHIKYVTK